jgi:hypothetical protein
MLRMGLMLTGQALPHLLLPCQALPPPARSLGDVAAARRRGAEEPLQWEPKAGVNMGAVLRGQDRSSTASPTCCKHTPCMQPQTLSSSV